MLDGQRLADVRDAPVEQEVGDDRHRAPGVVPLVLDLPFDVERVGHHHRGAERQRGVEGNHGLREVRQLHSHADARPNSQPRERRGEPIHVRLELPVRHRPIEEDQRRCVRILSGTPFEEAGQRDVLKLEDRRNAGVVEPMPGLGRHLLSGRSENSDYRAEYEASYHQQAAEAVLASFSFLEHTVRCIRLRRQPRVGSCRARFREP